MFRPPQLAPEAILEIAIVASIAATIVFICRDSSGIDLRALLLVRRAAKLRKRGHHDEARRQVEKAYALVLSGKCKDIRLFVGLASTASLSGQYEIACHVAALGIDRARRSHRRSRRRFECMLFYIAGASSMEIGKFAEAQAYLDEGIALSVALAPSAKGIAPDKFTRLIGFARLRSGDYEGALATYRDIAAGESAASPDGRCEPTTLGEIAMCLSRLGRREEAAQMMEESMVARTSPPSISLRRQ